MTQSSSDTSTFNKMVRRHGVFLAMVCTALAYLSVHDHQTKTALHAVMFFMLYFILFVVLCGSYTGLARALRDITYRYWGAMGLALLTAIQFTILVGIYSRYDAIETTLQPAASGTVALVVFFGLTLQALLIWFTLWAYVRRQQLEPAYRRKFDD